MLYLAATGSNVDRLGAHDQIGIMTSPISGNYSALKTGRLWASDCDALAVFGPLAPGRKRRVPHDDAFIKHLDRLEPYLDTCLFVTVPDVIECGEGTLISFMHHMDELQTSAFPLAYVMQDGSEALPMPHGAEVAFLGGSDAWRLEWGASMLRRAREAGLRTHVGRVNSELRMRNLSMTECDSADGTCLAYRSLAPGLQAIGGWLRAANGPALFDRTEFEPPRTPFEWSGCEEGLSAEDGPAGVRWTPPRRPVPWATPAQAAARDWVVPARRGRTQARARQAVKDHPPLFPELFAGRG